MVYAKVKKSIGSEKGSIISIIKHGKNTIIKQPQNNVTCFCLSLIHIQMCIRDRSYIASSCHMYSLGIYQVSLTSAVCQAFCFLSSYNLLHPSTMTVVILCIFFHSSSELSFQLMKKKTFSHVCALSGPPLSLIHIW